MLLDTTFLVDVVRGEDDVLGILEDVDVAYVSAVSTMEVWRGVHLSERSEEEREAVLELLEHVHEIPFSREHAFEAGRLYAELKRAGTPVANNDVVIASTAKVEDQPVVTRNTDDFERVEDIEVRGY